jgi:hypothetical protein
MDSSVSNLLYPTVQMSEIDQIVDEFLDNSKIKALDSNGDLYSYKRILRSDGHYDFIKDVNIAVPIQYLSSDHDVILWDNKYLCTDKGFAYSIENSQLIQSNVYDLESQEIMNGLPILSSDDYDMSGNKLRVVNYVIYLIVVNKLYIKDDEYVTLYEFQIDEILSFPQGKCINDSGTMLLLNINDKLFELNLIGNTMSIIPDNAEYI